MHMHRNTALVIINRIKSHEPIFPRHVDRTSNTYRFINALLMKASNERLGGFGEGARLVKEHDWFGNVSFFDILDRRIMFKTTISHTEPNQDYYANLHNNSQILPDPNPFQDY